MGLRDGTDKSGVKPVMACEGPFNVCSPDSGSGRGWVVTPRSLCTLLAIVSVAIAGGVAAYVCGGTVEGQ